MRTLNRRTFVKQSVLATTTLAALGRHNVLGANEKIVIGVMGCGGRGSYLAGAFAKRPDVEVAYLSDPDTSRFARTCQNVEKSQERKPKGVQDFRKILEDRSVDALVNATPDHWHALGTILACQAEKDVYVEKPMAYSIWEGRKMIEAARKYQRVVQVGMQSRSAPYMKKAVEYAKSGKIGEVHLVRVFNMMQHPLVKATPEQPVPPEVDYDLWCGPAAKLPYNTSRHWLNYAEYSCGPIPGDLVHQLDLARLMIGDIPAPRTVSGASAIYSLRDGRDTPDTQLAAYEYDQFTLHCESALWTPYLKKTPMEIRDTDAIPNWPFNGTRIDILGTKGFMYVGRHGDGWQVFDENSQLMVTVPGRQADQEHQDNFIQCMRDRTRPAADVEQGHYSVLLCHLANISWRVGNKALVFDSKSESFPDCPEANKYLKRAAARAPWVIPDKV